MLRCLTRFASLVARLAPALMLGCFALSSAHAQQSPTHYRHVANVPPGAIGQQQLRRGGPLPGYYQPVEIRAPQGTRISTATDGAFTEPSTEPVRAGMLIGAVYRLRVIDVPNRPGEEVFPTIELIDRLYSPLLYEAKFPVPVELTTEELSLALDGKYVTRIVYVEDPEKAIPVEFAEKNEHYFEALAGDDPLEVAESIGRPIAILRIGGRVPDANGPDDTFLFGCPPLLRYRFRKPGELLPNQLPPEFAPPRLGPVEPVEHAPPLMPIEVRRPAKLLDRATISQNPAKHVSISRPVRLAVDETSRVAPEPETQAAESADALSRQVVRIRKTRVR